ncbi:MAG: hypothetical protein Q7T47_09225, partial [Anaerolineales bacterium]|nr:hypothetical protein [Anaerolineales bacterium]
MSEVYRVSSIRTLGLWGWPEFHSTLRAIQSLSLNIPGACRPFSTGYAVCYDFLTFIDQYGGVALLGNPVSAFEFLSDGRIVQYFECARFEWHPEFARGENI